jgi:hypothetical protein
MKEFLIVQWKHNNLKDDPIYILYQVNSDYYAEKIIEIFSNGSYNYEEKKESDEYFLSERELPDVETYNKEMENYNNNVESFFAKKIGYNTFNKIWLQVINNKKVKTEQLDSFFK